MFPALICPYLWTNGWGNNKESLPGYSIHKLNYGKVYRTVELSPPFDMEGSQYQSLCSVPSQHILDKVITADHPVSLTKNKPAHQIHLYFGAKAWAQVLWMAKLLPQPRYPLKETLAMEGGYIGVSTYLLLEPPKSFGSHIHAGGPGFSCWLCVHFVLTQSPAKHSFHSSTGSRWCSSQPPAKNQHLPTPSSGHWELLFQHCFFDACKVISNSSYHRPLMGDGLINYIALTQLSMLRDNKNTVSPPPKISSKLAFFRHLHKDPAIKIRHLGFKYFP